MKCGGNIVSEHRFYDICDGAVDDILDPNEWDSLVCFGGILHPFFDQGKIEQALDPAVLRAERI